MIVFESSESIKRRLHKQDKESRPDKHAIPNVIPAEDLYTLCLECYRGVQHLYGYDASENRLVRVGK